MGYTFMKVFAYRNLHRKCWSVKALEGPLKGRVIYHAEELNLFNCKLKVSQAGRQRVLREQRKNVHAGVVGILDVGSPFMSYAFAVPITYNPYMYDSFVLAGTKDPVYNADCVELTKEAKVYAIL